MPFVAGKVAVGDPAGNALPGFEVHVQEYHAAADAAAISGRDRLSVGAEGHAINVALVHEEWVQPLPPAAVRVPHDHAAADAAAVSGRDRLSVGAEGHARNVALVHEEWALRQPLAAGRVPHHHAADAV